MNTNNSLLLIRIALGVVFIFHGVQKLMNIEQTLGFFGSLGIGAVIAYLVIAVEIVGGLGVLLGVYTKLSALGLAVVMIGAIYFIGIDAGFAKIEYNFVLLLTSIALSLSGPGNFALGGKK